MRKLNSFLFGIVTLLLFLSTSCDNELQLAADYKDITVTYAILNPKDSVHYFKIYKGYLTSENAFEAAFDWNNIYYPVDSIEVRFEEYSENGTLLRTAILDTTTQVDKLNGYFANPKQLLYYSTWKLDVDNTYRLIIKRLNTGKEVYAKIPLVGNFSVKYPMQSWNMNQENYSTIKFYSAPNAAAYDLYLHFYYIEVDKRTGSIEHKVLTKKLNSGFVFPTSSDEVSYMGFAPKSFYTIVGQSLTPNDNVVRYIDAINGVPFTCIRLQLWAADKMFLNYYNVSNPSASIVQNRLEYTNFVSEDKDAYGILSSRNTCVRDFQFSSLDHNEDTLVKGARTSGLGFDYYRNSPLFPFVK